jgi:AICAR transformylase/IMP cyclohydrolase PurH
MKRFIVNFFLCFSILISGCSTQIVKTNNSNGILTADETQTFLLGGIGQTQRIDVEKVCGINAKD